jgi:hypothetical protein
MSGPRLDNTMYLRFREKMLNDELQREERAQQSLGEALRFVSEQDQQDKQFDATRQQAADKMAFESRKYLQDREDKVTERDFKRSGEVEDRDLKLRSEKDKELLKGHNARLLETERQKAFSGEESDQSGYMPEESIYAETGRAKGRSEKEKADWIKEALGLNINSREKNARVVAGRKDRSEQLAKTKLLGEAARMLPRTVKIPGPRRTMVDAPNPEMVEATKVYMKIAAAVSTGRKEGDPVLDQLIQQYIQLTSEAEPEVEESGISLEDELE